MGSIEHPTKTYDVIVEDPPWSYGAKTKARDSRYSTQLAGQHYDVIGVGDKEINRKTGAGIENIAAEAPVGSWSNKDSFLFLWATNPKLPFAFTLMKMLGFNYKTTITWVKIRKDGEIDEGGQGWFFRGATEHCLLGTKGRAKIPAALRKANVFKARRGEHSAKPDEFYSLIESVTPGMSRLDVFARGQARVGWDVWGNEAQKADNENEAGYE